MIGVYEIRNTTTGDCYIGSSVDIFARWAWHTDHLANEKHPTWRLQEAWKEYGHKAFSFSVIRETSEENRLSVEVSLIQDRQPAYNGKPDDKCDNGTARERHGYSREGRRPPMRLTRVYLRLVEPGQFVQVSEYSNGAVREWDSQPMSDAPPYCPSCHMPYRFEFCTYRRDIILAAEDPLYDWRLPAKWIRRLSPGDLAQCLSGQRAISFHCIACDEPLLLVYAGQISYIVSGKCTCCGDPMPDTAISPSEERLAKSERQISPSAA